jgi:hypothetical protein
MRLKLRRAMPIYLIIGVLALMACVSIAISGDGSSSEIEEGINIEGEINGQEEDDDQEEDDS